MKKTQPPKGKTLMEVFAAEFEAEAKAEAEAELEAEAERSKQISELEAESEAEIILPLSASGIGTRSSFYRSSLPASARASLHRCSVFAPQSRFDLEEGQ